MRQTHLHTLAAFCCLFPAAQGGCIIAKYRLVDWIFAAYEGIELKEIYLLKPEAMEHWHQRWETKWHTSGDINNPKVPLTYVRKHGQLLHSALGELLKDSLE